MSVFVPSKYFHEQKNESNCSDNYCYYLLHFGMCFSEILFTGVTVNHVCALGWMTCAGTSIDVILCCLLLNSNSSALSYEAEVAK